MQVIEGWEHTVGGGGVVQESVTYVWLSPIALKLYRTIEWKTKICKIPESLMVIHYFYNTERKRKAARSQLK